MRHFMLTLPPIVLLLPLLAGCPGEKGGDGPPDASCDLVVAIGTGAPEDFQASVDGDTSEVILGFQGFRMLRVTLRIEGTDQDLADISGYVTIEETGVEVAQLPRTTRLVAGPDGAMYAEGFLVFFNDTPVSEIVGRDAELELIVRAAGCVGGSRVTLALRDDDECVDWDAAVPDAGILDGGVPDDAAACGEEP